MGSRKRPRAGCSANEVTAEAEVWSLRNTNGTTDFSDMTAHDIDKNEDSPTSGSTPSKKPRKYKRSEAAWLRRQEQGRAHARTMGMGNILPVVLPAAPDLFLKRPRGGKGVLRLLQSARIQSEDSCFLVPEDNDYILAVHPSSTSLSVRSTYRLAFRIDRGFDDKDGQLLRAFQWYSQSGAVVKIKSRHHGSYDPSVHLGPWRRASLEIAWTAETRGQTAPVDWAVDCLLAWLRQVVGNRVVKLLESHCPRNAAERAYIIDQAYEEKSLQELMVQRPALRQIGWLAVAVKQGAADFTHIDFGDAFDHFSVIGVLGDFRGARVILRQLGVSVPIRPGQLFFLRTRYLAHKATRFVGIRYVFVGFVCSNVAKDYMATFPGSDLPMDTVITPEFLRRAAENDEEMEYEIQNEEFE